MATKINSTAEGVASSTEASGAVSDENGSEFDYSLYIKNLRRFRSRRTLRGQAIGMVAISDAAAIFCGFGFAAIARRGDLDLVSLVGVGIYVPLYFLFALQNNAFAVAVITRADRSIGRSLASLALALGVMTVALFAAKVGSALSRREIGTAIVISAIVLGIVRYLMARTIQTRLGKRSMIEVALIDTESSVETDASFIVDARRFNLRPDPQDAGMVDRLAQIADEADCITVYCSEARRGAWAFMLKSFTTRSEIRVPELDRLVPLGLDCRGGKVSVVISQNKLGWHEAALKRIFDLVLAFAALLVLLIPMLLVALLIRLESRGPVLFRQTRIGYSNRQFTVFKFRSMFVRPPEESLTLTQRNDARVTRIGKIIRATSIDELPQLFNVLIGDMSLVGPRPHAPLARAGDDLYWTVDPSYWHRHAVKPGITGLAQVRGFRGNTFVASDLEKRLNADLVYINDWSLLRDAQILLSTIGIIFKRQNAF